MQFQDAVLESGCCLGCIYFSWQFDRNILSERSHVAIQPRVGETIVFALSANAFQVGHLNFTGTPATEETV